MSNYAFNRDHMNDKELGTGIYAKPTDNLILDLGDAMNELKALDPNWVTWFDANIPDEYDYVAILPIVQKRVDEFKQESFKTLDILVGYIPPEPEAQATEIAADQDWYSECVLLSDDRDLGESPTETRSMIDF